MITHTDLLVEIGDNLVHGCMSLALSQSIHGHHYFQARFSGEGIENDPLGLGSDSLNQIGQTFKTELSNNANESSNFKGIITSVRAIASGHSGQGQIIVFEGYSPTILLENGQSSQSYVNMLFSDIIHKACQGPASNLLKVTVKPSHDSRLAYTVQYNETAFSFINRMACRFGEWLYYDGSEMVVGNHKQPEIALIYGSDLQTFDYVMQSASVVRQFMAHSYSDNQTQNINTKSVQPGISGAGKQVYDNATKTWQAPQNGILLHFDGDSLKKQLDDVAKTTVEGAAASQIKFNGSSTNPSIFPGATIKIHGFDAREYGSYIVTSVDHHFNIGGDYHNTFTAIASDVKASPYSNPALTPRCEAQAGVVDDNNDPDGLGRIKVRLYWQRDTVTPWLRIVMPYAGSSKGMYFVPEKGEEVMVGFEGGNAEMPFVIGSVYHGNMKPDNFKSNNNDIKAIQTRSGHIIELNDDENGNWGITIKDKNDNKVQIDSKGENINITALGKITLSAKDIDILAQDKLTLESGKTIQANATEGMTTRAKKLDVEISDDYSLNTKKFECVAEKVDIQSTKDNLTLSSGKEVATKSKAKKIKLS
jgi:type VI secretion system secreted protein VgrG